ncbi:MAG: apolipoprotein N-acyltransferase [Bdellovibrionia bacterium]
MKNWFQSMRKYQWAIFSGVLIGTSYIPFPPWAVLFCYAPLLFWANSPDRSLKEVFWGGWWTQFVLTLIGFHWIAYTANEFAYIPWPLAILILFIFSSLMHIYIPLALVLGKKFFKPYFLLAAPLLLSLAERYYPAIFQWHLGYTYHYAGLPIFHFADIIGTAGLSTLTLLCSGFWAWWWPRRKDPQTQSRKWAATVLTLFIALNILGSFYGQKWNQTDSTLQVSLIQANIGNLEKVYAEQGRAYQASIVSRFLELTQKQIQQQKSDLIIWPETAFPDFLDSHLLERKHTQQLVNGLFPLDTPLMTGAYSKDPQSDGSVEQSTYNALFLVRPDGTSFSPPYRKTHLLAFGEYLPLSERFPILLKWLPFVSNFGRGLGPSVLSLQRENQPDLNFGGQICYESLYPHFSRELAKKGSHFLVNVTNDSWFGRPFEPYQHMYMTLARGLENRRPVLRSTNTGVSTVMLANGKVLEQSPLHQEWAGHYNVPYLSEPPVTFYTQWGHFDFLVYIVILIVLLIKGLGYAKSRNA